MKSLPAVLMIALAGLATAGCEGGSKKIASASQARSGTQTSSAPAFTFGLAHTLRGLKGDADDDDVKSKSAGSTPEGDSDADNDNDYRDELGNGYYDKDDGAVRSFGRAASVAEGQTLTAVVKRYSEAAVAGDGATACSLIDSGLARTVPDYGQGTGPAYMGATTCQAIVSRLLEHSHGELTGAIEVTGMRVKGNRAYVLLGSTTRAARSFSLRREAGAWKMDKLVSIPLP